jgi:flap endonuclease-1
MGVLLTPIVVKDTARHGRNQTCRAVSQGRCHVGDTNAPRVLCEKDKFRRVSVTIALADLRGRRLAVDASGELYQFLALIRLPDGTPLQDAHGRITSHLSGLFHRTTRLVADFGLQFVFVFDGRPPIEKTAEIQRRRAVRERYELEAADARRAGDLAQAYSKSTMTSRLTPDIIADAKALLRLMGLPTVQALSEAEAQAAHMARRGDVWAAASKDYDSLLFGASRLLRFLTITGRAGVD